MALIPLLGIAGRWWLLARRSFLRRGSVITALALIGAGLQFGWRAALVALIVLAVLALADLAWFVGRAGERTRWGLAPTSFADEEPVPYWEAAPSLRVLRGGRDRR